MTSQALAGPLTSAFLGARLQAAAAPRRAQWNAAGAREGGGSGAGIPRSSPRRAAASASRTGIVAMAADGDSRDRKGVRVQIRVEHQVDFGEHVALLGSAKWLGRWKDPVPMQWSEQGWFAELEAEAGEQAEFKFVVCGGGGVQQWEGGPNRTVSVPADQALLRATTAWDATDEGLPLVPLADGNEPWPTAAKKKERKEGNGAASDKGPARRQDPYAQVEGSEFTKGWQGREVNFMRSNNHSHERRAVWNTSGLGGPALELVEGDRGAGNWWRKLEVVRNLVTSADNHNRLEALAYSAVYLQWINTGQIECVEDGGHHRPNKHAQIAREIFRWLEKDSVQKTMESSPESVLVMRKIHPRLPAFTADFTASVPLTRIRDIAHRGDIPHDLKQEIKHTIQNKLHRCAGPEDLVATELLLQRVSAREGEYSGAFLEQLRIFYGELKDFFNASSLTEQLDGIRPSLDDAKVAMLETFLAAKQKVDELPVGDGQGVGVDTLLAALHSLTGLRAALLSNLSSGLRNDASDDAIAMRQKWRLSEIGLEDYAFVLLSRLANEAEGQGGPQRMGDEARGGSPRLFDACVGAAVLALRQVGLSGWQQAECLCVEQELAAWQKAGVRPKGAPGGGHVSADDLRWWALRFKASLDRALRVTEGYSECLLALYAGRSQVLGKALGIEENAVRTFAEAEIRAGVVFQLSKVLTMLLKALRAVLGSEGWDVLMPGTATGRLIQVERIDPGQLQSLSEDVILLVHRADGDEEVRAAGQQVQAVILLQELPHLSHLAVRARQEKVPFVTCEDEDLIQKLRAAAEKKERISLSASSDGVVVDLSGSVAAAAAPAGEGSANGTWSTAPTVPVAHQPVKASREVYVPLIQLRDASVETCGAKATSCAQLLNLAIESQSSREPLAAFDAPQGAVIPFGMLDDALRAAGAYQEYRDLVEKSETAPVQELEDVCGRLRTLIKGLALPSASLKLLQSVFGDAQRLIVRSSANVEDLAGMSGAGLYDSIPNVRLSDPDDLSAAVTSVWASLFSRRAALSRRAGGVRQGDSAMAVLVQELVAPELSFVLHTKNPLGEAATPNGNGSSNGNGAASLGRGQVHAELAPGLGETLASGTRGTPWRFSVDKQSGEVVLTAVANFSEQLVVAGGGRGDGTVVRQAVDYSQLQLSLSPDRLKGLAKRLGHVGMFIEESFGSAQDIEGCVVGDRVVVVQSRPQP